MSLWSPSPPSFPSSWSPFLLPQRILLASLPPPKSVHSGLGTPGLSLVGRTSQVIPQNLFIHSFTQLLCAEGVLCACH